MRASVAEVVVALNARRLSSPSTIKLIRPTVLAPPGQGSGLAKQFADNSVLIHHSLDIADVSRRKSHCREILLFIIARLWRLAWSGQSANRFLEPSRNLVWVGTRSAAGLLNNPLWLRHRDSTNPFQSGVRGSRQLAGAIGVGPHGGYCWTRLLDRLHHVPFVSGTFAMRPEGTGRNSLQLFDHQGMNGPPPGSQLAEHFIPLSGGGPDYDLKSAQARILLSTLMICHSSWTRIHLDLHLRDLPQCRYHGQSCRLVLGWVVVGAPSMQMAVGAPLNLDEELMRRRRGRLLGNGLGLGGLEVPRGLSQLASFPRRGARCAARRARASLYRQRTRDRITS
mmetsp:Transcript_106335/g.243429  ORF Transcript_106335/g.243429 Transcript_106335/m.243429 type:complete len:338 (+) Transcript_106335:1018-2031(+)